MPQRQMKQTFSKICFNQSLRYAESKERFVMFLRYFSTAREVKFVF